MMIYSTSGLLYAYFKKAHIQFWPQQNEDDS